MVGDWRPDKIGTGWGIDIGTITMYKAAGNNESYGKEAYVHTVAHEFGHVLGLNDAYLKNDTGQNLLSNIEVVTNRNEFYKDSTIMDTNGKVYVNDIEMLLEAFATKQWQSYINRTNNSVSQVIRLKQYYGVIE